MGQAKLKKDRPTVFVGPRGNRYYCRNRCGRVVYVKDNNESFIERRGLPMYGWCSACIAEAEARAQDTSRSAAKALAT